MRFLLRVGFSFSAVLDELALLDLLAFEALALSLDPAALIFFGGCSALPSQCVKRGRSGLREPAAQGRYDGNLTLIFAVLAWLRL